jgi:radical SAM superfamily enzyme YgiQ (UPF0313 family)
MKVCLINIPDTNSLDDRLDPPLGLMYLSSILKQNNIDCEILDLAFYTNWDSIIKNLAADLFGLTVYSASFNKALKINKLIRQHHPNAKIVWGGPHPTFCKDQVDNVDYIVLNEGERSFLTLCRFPNNNTKYLKSPLIKNLDDLPKPERDKNLFKYTRKVNGLPSTSIMTSRGCYSNCLFCGSRLFWHYPRKHSNSRIIEELKEIKDLGYDAFHCWSDIFTLNHKTLYDLLKEIRKLNFYFRCNGDLRRDTKELLQELYKSGCREICYGIESGDQRILDIVNKNSNVERNKLVIKWAKEAGISVKIYLIVGSPGETWESVRKTIDFVKETKPDFYTIFNFVPMPGSPFYHNYEKYNIKFRTYDWDQFFNIGGQNIGGMVVDTEFMTAEEVSQARRMMLSEMPKQQGILQDYYKKLLG